MRTKLFSRFSTLITAAIIALVGSAVVEASTKPGRDVKILAFGDSLTAGYRLEKSEAYPAQLQKLLQESGWKATVINGGRSGDTSAQGLRRLEWNLKQGPFDLVILALGANDGLRRMDLNELEKNLSQMIERFQQNKGRVLLCGLKLPINYEKQYRERFETIFPTLAKRYRITLLPFLLEDVALSADLNLNDLIHPNADGHQIIARRLLSFVVPELEKINP